MQVLTFAICQNSDKYIYISERCYCAKLSDSLSPVVIFQLNSFPRILAYETVVPPKFRRSCSKNILYRKGTTINTGEYSIGKYNVDCTGMRNSKPGASNAIKCNLHKYRTQDFDVNNINVVNTLSIANHHGKPYHSELSWSVGGVQM